MADITLLKFDKDGKLVGEPPQVGPKVTDLVLIAHGWNEKPEDARDHYQHLVDPLKKFSLRTKRNGRGALSYRRFRTRPPLVAN
jgi:hypothetical protein